jgi:hypothetical protein
VALHAAVDALCASKLGLGVGAAVDALCASKLGLGVGDISAAAAARVGVGVGGPPPASLPLPAPFHGRAMPSRDVLFTSSSQAPPPPTPPSLRLLLQPRSRLPLSRSGFARQPSLGSVSSVELIFARWVAEAERFLTSHGQLVAPVLEHIGSSSHQSPTSPGPRSAGPRLDQADPMVAYLHL